MADIGNIDTMLAGLDDDTHRVLKSVFEYVLRDIRFGGPDAGVPAKNFGGGFFQGTTPHIANTEFSVTHTFSRIPYLAFAVLPLDTVNAAAPRLIVTRAADRSRIYLKSPDIDTTFMLFVEG